MMINKISLNAEGDLLIKDIKNHKASIDSLQIKVEYGGRRYVTGNLNGTQIEIGTLNDLVKLLGDPGIKINHRELLYKKIIELKAESKPLIKQHALTSIGHKIRHFFGSLLFNRKEKLNLFQTELKIHQDAKGASLKPRVPQPVIAKPAAAKTMTAKLDAPQTPVAAKTAAFNHQKTPVAKLQQNVINPFRIDFQGRTSEDQFQEIFQYIKDFRAAHPGKQLAITYAANSQQANELYKGYETGATPKISGSNQAQVFGLLAAEIKKNKWDNDVHILPIPTCKYVKEGKDKVRHVSDMDDVIKAMNNIKTHKENKNCFVLGTQNETCSSKCPLAIGGGGAAGKVWENTEQQKHAHKLVHEWMAPIA